MPRVGYGNGSGYVLSSKLTQQVRKEINDMRRGNGLPPLMFKGATGFEYAGRKVKSHDVPETDIKVKRKAAAGM